MHAAVNMENSVENRFLQFSKIKSYCLLWRHGKPENFITTENPNVQKLFNSAHADLESWKTGKRRKK